MVEDVEYSNAWIMWNGLFIVEDGASNMSHYVMIDLDISLYIIAITCTL